MFSWIFFKPWSSSVVTTEEARTMGVDWRCLWGSSRCCRWLERSRFEIRFGGSDEILHDIKDTTWHVESSFAHLVLKLIWIVIEADCSRMKAVPNFKQKKLEPTWRTRSNAKLDPVPTWWCKHWDSCELPLRAESLKLHQTFKPIQHRETETQKDFHLYFEISWCWLIQHNSKLLSFLIRAAKIQFNKMSFFTVN